MARKTLIENTQVILSYLHCARCVHEVLDPDNKATTGESPESYARLSVGWTERGLQVWCVRHDCNVLHVDFEGRKHPASTTARTN